MMRHPSIFRRGILPALLALLLFLGLSLSVFAKAGPLQQVVITSPTELQPLTITAREALTQLDLPRMEQQATLLTDAPQLDGAAVRTRYYFLSYYAYNIDHTTGQTIGDPV